MPAAPPLSRRGHRSRGLAKCLTLRTHHQAGTGRGLPRDPSLPLRHASGCSIVPQNLPAPSRGCHDIVWQRPTEPADDTFATVYRSGGCPEPSPGRRARRGFVRRTATRRWAKPNDPGQRVPAASARMRRVGSRQATTGSRQGFRRNLGSGEWFIEVFRCKCARRQAVSIIESGTVWHASPPHPTLQTLAASQDAALFYKRLYKDKKAARKLINEYDNFIYERLYRLFAEIKGSRPGNTYLLYNFTMRCVELLRIEVNPVTPGAFRMRIARMLHRQRKGLGSLADLFPDLPPVRFDQLSGEEFATFGNMAAIVSDLPLMAYWAAPKRRRNKRSHSTSRVANQTRGPSDDDRS